jgi:hypothetical protein
LNSSLYAKNMSNIIQTTFVLSPRPPSLKKWQYNTTFLVAAGAAAIDRNLCHAYSLDHNT